MDTIKDALIIIVDDEPENLGAVENAFIKEDASCDIIKAPNGKTALSIMEKKTPDLVITDWDMPQMDGLSLVRNIKDHPDLRDIPIIMYTGVMTTSEHLSMALKAGAVDYIRKPLDQIELLARVRTVLELSDSFKKIKKQKQELQDALDNIKTLKGLIPICAHCKKIRDDEGFWKQVEHFVAQHTEAQFSHGICPQCLEKVRKECSEYLKRK